MKARSFVVLAIILCLCPAAYGQSGKKSELGMLVSADWVAAHLNDSNLVLLHAHWTNGGYKREHIPGARFLWLESLAKDTPELNTEMPSLSDATPILQALGITDQSRIVVYFEGQNITMSTRMVLTFAYFGLGDRVSLLDGGFDAWKSGGHPVTKDVPVVKRGSFIPTPHPEVVTDAAWVSSHLTDRKVTIVDARARRFFDGSAGSPPGHIPHAVSIPFSSVVDSTNKLLDPDTLRQMFEKAGVTPGNQVVTYCHIGQQASLVYFVARYLGYQAMVYDGSFQDWADRGNLPVENRP